MRTIAQNWKFNRHISKCSLEDPGSQHFSEFSFASLYRVLSMKMLFVLEFSSFSLRVSTLGIAYQFFNVGNCNVCYQFYRLVSFGKCVPAFVPLDESPDKGSRHSTIDILREFSKCDEITLQIFEKPSNIALERAAHSLCYEYLDWSLPFSTM